MKRKTFWLPAMVLIFTFAGFSQGSNSTANAAAVQPTVQPTVASTVDREISLVEREVTDAAQAMPEDKFNFSPESLNIPGADYKGVRTFALEVKHIAASKLRHLVGNYRRQVSQRLHGRERAGKLEDQG